MTSTSSTTMTTSSSSSSSDDPPFFANNMTAESHYRAAREAIEATFDKFIEQQTTSGNETAVGGDSNSRHSNGWGGSIPEGVDRNLALQFIKAAKESMLQNLDRIVKPVDDDDYSDYIDQYHFILDHKRQPTLDDIEAVNNDDDEDSVNNRQETMEEFESHLDEEELIDAHSWKDAQILRARVRAKAARVQELRERVLNATTDKIQKDHLDPHVDDSKPVIVLEEQAETQLQEMPAVMSSVENSLNGLSDLLDDPKWKQFPDRIKSLQHTIEVIQKESAPDRPFSQTERAITGRGRQQRGEEQEGSDVDTMEDILVQKAKLMNVQDMEESDIEDDKQTDGESIQDDMEDDENDAGPLDAVDRLALFGQMFS